MRLFISVFVILLALPTSAQEDSLRADVVYVARPMPLAGMSDLFESETCADSLQTFRHYGLLLNQGPRVTIAVVITADHPQWDQFVELACLATPVQLMFTRTPTLFETDDPFLLLTRYQFRIVSESSQAEETPPPE